MPRLVVEKGNDRGKTFVIPPKGAIVFGRDSSATIQVKDTMASRMHFKIEARETGYWVVDLESMNGTLLNNHPVKEAQLQPGDLIKVGETMYSFLSDETGVDAVIGQRFGGYRILERIGRGGMGTVYKAEQVDLQRHVALKIISDDHARRKDFVDLFVHEARAAAKLNHPNIVQVYDVKKHNELYFFSMEFVPGGSVQELLNRQRKLPIDQAIRMILDAARGLEYAHKKEIIHRDVKPDNFMIGEGGTIKIGDLGLAQRLGEKLSADDENSVIGTPHYIAPEQVLGRPADYRSDIYSLGSTMYRMIAGFTPFQAPSVRDLVNKKAREEATPLHTACPDVPVRVGEICARMMARNPDQRYQTMGEVIVDLEKYVRDTSGEGIPPAAAAEAQVANRRLLLTAVGLLAIVVLGGVVGAVYVMNRKPEVPSPTGTPIVADDSDRGAEAKLDYAKAAELKLDPKKPEEIQDVIKLFSEIAERWPNSPFASEAVQHRTALEARLREFRAQQQLTALEEADRAAWGQILQTFQSGREDLSEVDRSILAFQNFARDEAFAGTAAAQKAELWAGKVLEWKAQVGARRKALDGVRAEAGALIDDRKFQAAWELYNRFATETLAIKLEPGDRYNTLLYETVARKLQERVVEESNVAWYKVEERTRVLEAAGDFKAAVELCEVVVRDYTNHPRRSAQGRIKELWERITEQRLLAERVALEEQHRKEEDDLRDFETWSARWRKSVLALDSRAAARDALKQSESRTGHFPRLAATAARLRTRSVEMDLVADFRDALVKAWADPRNAGIPRTLDLGTLSGTVVKVTDRAIFVKIGGGGEGEFTYAEITRSFDSANRFLAWARAVVRDPEPRPAMGLVVLCFEIGLWERAAELLRGLEKSADPDVRRFVVEYKPLAEENRFHDADEIEAQKHFDRLEWLARDLTDMSKIEAASRAIQALRTTYARTRVASERKGRIDEVKKVVDDRGGRELEKRKREEDYKKVQQMRSAVTGQIDAREKDLLGALSRLPEPDRQVHTAEALFAYRHVGDSTTMLRTLWDGLVLKPPSRNEQSAILISRTALAYARNLYVQRLPDAAVQKVLNDASNLLKEQAGGEPAWWSSSRVSFGTWCREFEDVRKRYGERLNKLEADFQDDPTGDAMWNLAQAREVIRDYTEARIVYTVLLELFPESTSAKNGDALWRLAEVCYQFRDLSEAKRLYNKLAMEHPAHRKVKDDRAFDGVSQRLRQIGEIEVKMGPGK